MEEKKIYIFSLSYLTIAIIIINFIYIALFKQYVFKVLHIHTNRMKKFMRDNV